MNDTSILFEPAKRTAQAVVEARPHYADKRGIAEMLDVSVRSVDNFLAEGMPHFKLTARCIRFDVDEVRAWLKERYGTRRLGRSATLEGASQ